MTALYIILGVLGIVLFIWLGYFLWSTSIEKYDYNIFGLGVIIRGLVSVGCLYFAGTMTEQNDGSTMVWLIAFGIMWLWTFLVTAFKTNIIIAIFSLLYQLFAVFLVKSAIERFFRD